MLLPPKSGISLSQFLAVYSPRYPRTLKPRRRRKGAVALTAVQAARLREFFILYFTNITLILLAQLCPYFS